MFKRMIRSYIFKKFSKKFAVAIVGLLISSAPFLAKHGIHIQVDQAILTAAIIAGLEALRNFLKHKYNIKDL